MRVRDFLESNRIHLLKADDTIREAAAVFSEKKIDAAPVVDENDVLTGLFTKSHIFKAIRNGVDYDSPVSDFMTKEVVAGHPDDDVEDRFYFNHSYLPVVENDKAVGLISIPDFVKTYHDHYKMTRQIMDAIIQSSKNLIITTDSNGGINFVNRSAEEVLGLREKMLLGHNLNEFIPEVNLLEIINNGDVPPLTKANVKGQPYFIRSYPIKIGNNLIGAVAIFQDIEDLENIVNELETVKELNENLDAIIESSSDGIFVCDGKANVLRINRAYDEITGLDTSDFYGKNMADLVTGGFFSESVTLIVLKKKEPMSIIQKTSTGKSLLATGRPVFDDKGEISRVVTSVRDITDLYDLQHRLAESKKITEQYRMELDSLRIKRVKNIEGLIVGSEKMHQLVDIAIRLAKVDSSILITGESGTGKDLVAGIIHKYSAREKGPFIKVNCGAIPANLLESELFGYEEGAFTGARKGGKPGYFEMAEGGILFLDEIGELPYDLQSKFLRVLQHTDFNRVGGQRFIKSNVRVLAATNRDLLEMVHTRTFREDLYYRLNVVPLYLPPLRERVEDVQFLVSHFLKFFNDSYNMTKRISPDVVDIFEKYNWPGNVRELRNLVERMIVMSPEEVITRLDLPESICKNDICGETGGITVPGIIPLKEALESVEKQLIEKVYERFPNTREMAKSLKISAPSIVRKAAKYGIKKKY